MNTSQNNTGVYLNLQLPERELDWLSNTLLEQLNSDEHMWVHRESELGPNATASTVYEKVTGKTHTANVRILCTQERANVLIALLQNNRYPEGIRWQQQALLAQGTL